MSLTTISKRTSRPRYQRALRQMETLEPRTLLSAAPVVTSYAIDGLIAGGGAYDSSGALWILNYDSNHLSGVSLDKIVNQNVVDSIDVSSYQPFYLAGGPNGHIYMSDIGNAIDDVDTIGHTVQSYAVDLAGTFPTQLTITGDGAVWFLGGDVIDSNNNTVHTSQIGRLDPGTHSVTIYSTDSSLSNSSAVGIAANGNDAVWVAMAGAEDQDTNNPGAYIFGTNRIVAASYNGSAIGLDHKFDVNSGNATADASNEMGSIVAAADGSVWFTLANNPYSPHTDHAADLIVHATASGAQTSYAVGTAADGLTVSGLQFDGNSDLWFTELSGAQFGSFDGANFTYYTNPTNSGQFQSAINSTGTQLSILTQGSDIINVGIAPAAIVFSGTANNLTAKEDTTFNNTPLATFTAPTPTGAYTATITWGDNTTTVVSPTDLGGNTYAVIISGKSFTTQGTYNGTITIEDSSNVVAGTLSFTTTIGDIPLNVTSVTATPLILRIVTLTATFTDDGDLALSTWKATINWGDGTSSTGLIVRDPTQAGRYIVLSLHQYKTRGTYAVKITVTTNEALAAITNDTKITTVTAR